MLWRVLKSSQLVRVPFLLNQMMPHSLESRRADWYLPFLCAPVQNTAVHYTDICSHLTRLLIYSYFTQWIHLANKPLVPSTTYRALDKWKLSFSWVVSKCEIDLSLCVFKRSYDFRQYFGGFLFKNQTLYFVGVFFMLYYCCVFDLCFAPPPF